MPTPSTADQVTKLAKDAVYATIGLGVLAFQQLQVGRNELAKWLDGQVGDAKGSLGTVQVKVEDGLKTIEERLTALEGQAEEVLEDLQGRLPESVQDLATQVIDFATKARADLFDRFGYTPAKSSKASKASKATKAA
jgi:hypothetical protein